MSLIPPIARRFAILVLSRKVGERIYLDTPAGRITVVVVDVDHNKIRLGFLAPREVRIMREELLPPEEGEVQP